MAGQPIGTVILPVWPSAYWWPDVLPLLSSHPHLDLGYSSDVLVYPADANIDPSHLPCGRLLALRFAGDH